MNDFNAHALDAAAETLFGGWDAIEEVIDEVLDIHEESPDTKPQFFCQKEIDIYG